MQSGAAKGGEGMTNSPGMVWNADFVVDTNVLSNALDDGAILQRLIDLVQRMTAKEEYGSGWLAMATFLEMLATSNPKKRIQLVELFHHLLQVVGSRVKIFAPFQMLIEAEWSDRRVPYWKSAHLEAVTKEALNVGDIGGTFLGKARDEFLAWKKTQRTQYRKTTSKWRQLFVTNTAFRSSVEEALRNWKAPEAYATCDDVALGIMRSDGRQPDDTAFENARRCPKDYLCTWTFALLVRMSQFAQTIPGDIRQAKFSEFGDVLRPNKNDLVDANVAATGAKCGILITEDNGLMERVNLLYQRNLMRLQAFGLNFLADAWRPPSATSGSS
jgi:hypothetical protein